MLTNYTKKEGDGSSTDNRENLHFDGAPDVEMRRNHKPIIEQRKEKQNSSQIIYKQQGGKKRQTINICAADELVTDNLLID